MRVFCEVTVSYSPFMWSLSLRWVGRWVLLVLQLKFTDLRHERIFLLPLSRQTASEITFKLIQLMNFGLKLASVDLIRLQFERLIMFLHFGHGPIELFLLYLICFLFHTLSQQTLEDQSYITSNLKKLLAYYQKGCFRFINFGLHREEKKRWRFRSFSLSDLSQSGSSTIWLWARDLNYCRNLRIRWSGITE